MVGISLSLVSCAGLLESRVATVTVPAPADVHCIERALDGLFGAGAARPNAQATRFVVAAFPWEGYVRTSPAAGGELAVEIELTRARRYPDDRGSVAGLLQRAGEAVVNECGAP